MTDPTPTPALDDLQRRAARAPGADSLLAMGLSAAVPLWQAEMTRWPWDRCEACLDGLSLLIASRGDDLLYGAKRKGETADLFNRLARGVAVMSFHVGGVRLFGQHFLATHPDFPAKGDGRYA